jgi:glycerophosphoryl diester phosphodiesterase
MVQRRNMQDRTIISSFNPLAVRAVKWVNKTITTGFLMETLELVFLFDFARPDCINPRADLLNQDLMSYIERRRIKVNVWTVNTASGIRYMVKKFSECDYN